MTLIAIDCGSSRIKIALFRGGDLLEVEPSVPEAVEAITPFRAVLAGLVGEFPEASTASAAVSCVAPSRLEGLLSEIEAELGVQPLLISTDLDHGLRLAYDPPGSLGSDRLADCAGALEMNGAPCIVVDFGTATTINVVVKDKAGRPEFIGGAICAGYDMTEAVFSAALPQLTPGNHTAPTKSIGASTADGIASGLILGHAAMVDGLIHRMKGEAGIPRAFVVATGGRAGLLAPLCREIQETDPILTLRGMWAIARRCGLG